MQIMRRVVMCEFGLPAHLWFEIVVANGEVRDVEDSGHGGHGGKCGAEP